MTSSSYATCLLKRTIISWNLSSKATNSTEENKRHLNVTDFWNKTYKKFWVPILKITIVYECFFKAVWSSKASKLHYVFAKPFQKPHVNPI